MCRQKSSVDASFWRELGTKKLDELKLSEEPVPITGYICPARHAQVGSQLELDAESFGAQQASSRQGYHTVPGVLYLLNSLESFKTFDRAEAVHRVAAQIWEDICNGGAESDPSLLCRFLLLAYADLKNYQYRYWFAFPALKPLQAFTATTQSLEAAFEQPVAGKVIVVLHHCSPDSRLRCPRMYESMLGCGIAAQQVCS
ncbi:unnamed protein product [Ostreobium quekettii]|uniref:Ubiquitin-like modifier-activating enzyme ATG7 n=1 Tax=Ostreobium quekettii TaxID=121088 RepID=A0A8S1JGX9_9CHLO|nr:unnamed protein product [Ostreobium quekettii]